MVLIDSLVFICSVAANPLARMCIVKRFARSEDGRFSEMQCGAGRSLQLHGFLIYFLFGLHGAFTGLWPDRFRRVASSPIFEG